MLLAILGDSGYCALPVHDRTSLRTDLWSCNFVILCGASLFLRPISPRILDRAPLWTMASLLASALTHMMVATNAKKRLKFTFFSRLFIPRGRKTSYHALGVETSTSGKVSTESLNSLDTERQCHAGSGGFRVGHISALGP
ncbi:hypothetical protein LMH87_004427 [Akanthomyces muscarius]|uniref:Uncharacterized protein n=1 Tax=Akanthomyces muscarius TaxID=2231603 RepID=A0A9W8Q3T0_AKAMU|nr:hypothetical protein LMH87_004427 [Akanthomyces muscarius]KAJ4145579.1 hypothetical protein LMH87_004427 [Akanthomyces muscarius]